MSVRTRKPGAERREEIVKAVLRIIGERGVTSLTTTAVAEEVGLTSGALFRHFASRDEMLQEAVRYGLAQVEGTFPDASLPAVERLLELARNRVRLLGSDPGLAWLLRSQQAYLMLPENAVEQLRDLVRRSQRYLLDAIREGAAQRGIRDDIEPEVLLVLVMGTIHTLVGMPGVHGPVTGGGYPDPARVLSALGRLLAPPEEVNPAERETKETDRRRHSNRR
jgi:TetR/AcrR family transcriptional regulator